MHTWSLLKIVYTCLPDRSGAIADTNLGYCLVPSRWQECTLDRLAEQVQKWMASACAQYNQGINQTEEPAHIVYFDWRFEWVPESVLATKPWIKANDLFHVDDSGKVHLQNALYTGQPERLTYRRNPWGFFEERLLGAGVSATGVVDGQKPDAPAYGAVDS